MSPQMMRMLAISLLVGFVTAGLVWYASAGWSRLRGLIEKRAFQQRLKKDAEALLKQGEKETKAQ